MTCVIHIFHLLLAPFLAFCIHFSYGDLSLTHTLVKKNVFLEESVVSYLSHRWRYFTNFLRRARYKPNITTSILTPLGLEKKKSVFFFYYRVCGQERAKRVRNYNYVHCKKAGNSWIIVDFLTEHLVKIFCNLADFSAIWLIFHAFFSSSTELF